MSRERLICPDIVHQPRMHSPPLDLMTDTDIQILIRNEELEFGYLNLSQEGVLHWKIQCWSLGLMTASNAVTFSVRIWHILLLIVCKKSLSRENFCRKEVFFHSKEILLSSCMFVFKSIRIRNCVEIQPIQHGIRKIDWKQSVYKLWSVYEL